MPYPDPRVFWARTFGTRRRQLWIHGRDLIRVGGEYGSEHNARPTAFIGDTMLTLDDMRPNNGHGANRALRECLRFWLPESAPCGTHTIRLCRNDGVETELQTAIESISTTSFEPRKLLISDRGEISETIELPPRTTLDLAGRTLRPASGFRGRELFKLSTGSRLSNGRIEIDEEDPDLYPITVAGGNIQLHDLVIHNTRPGGVGVFMGSTKASEFIHLTIRADRHFELFPGYRSESNVFARIQMSGIRGSADSEVGRGFGGSDNLIAWCSWRDIDRGPTLQSHGAPLSRMLFFECEQFNTGLSMGASEGLLFETGGTITSSTLGAPVLQLNIDRVPSNQTARLLQVGNIVCVMNGSKQWARIQRAERMEATGDFLVTLDRSFANSHDHEEQVPIYVGSALTETTIARCRFRDGRAGMTFWGPVLDCHVIDNEFRSLDYGIVHLDRTEPTIAFMWETEYRHNVGRNVSQGRIAIREPLQEPTAATRID